MTAIRVAASLVAICAWIVASNHCALGLMPVSKAEAGHHGDGCCDDESKPTKGPGDSGDPQACCQSLKVTAFTPANPVSHDATFFVLQPFFATVFSHPCSLAPHLNPLEIDTGPPRVVSFAESVLQRSIPANAPPLV